MGGVFAHPFTKRTMSPMVINSKPGKQILSTEQKQLLRQSWMRLRFENDKIVNCGDEIMCNILKLYPQIRRLFLTSINGSEQNMNTKLINVHHARIFVTVLDFTMKNLDDLENDVAPTLMVLGRRHRCKHFESNNNNHHRIFMHFNEEFFDYFLPATLQYVAKCDTKLGPPSVDTMQAWAVLLIYIISKLKLGFHTESFQKKTLNQWYH